MKRVYVCAENFLEDNTKKCFTVEERKIMLVKKEGKFYATQDICTHAQASLSAGKLCGFEIECPLHGAKFDIRSGEVTVLPAVKGLKVYQTDVDDGKVYVIFPE